MKSYKKFLYLLLTSLFFPVFFLQLKQHLTGQKAGKAAWKEKVISYNFVFKCNISSIQLKDKKYSKTKTKVQIKQIIDE